MKKTIVILIGFLPDPRMTNRINLEKRIGNLHVICWDKGRNMLQMPHEDGYKLHVIHIDAGNDPIKRLIPYKQFVNQAMKLLVEISPDLIDLQGLDMLKIADTYKKRARKKVRIIYEVADLHRLIVDDQSDPVRKLVKWYLVNEDRRLEKRYEELVITSTEFYDKYFHNFVDKSKVFYMPNVPDLSAFRTYTKKNEGDFTVGFIGSIRYIEQMKNLIEASQQGNFHVLIAGFEDDPHEIESLCTGKDNIEWVGTFNFLQDVAGLYSKCDVIYSVYNADMSNVRVALPNKLYESVYCRLPIIVARGTYLERIVDDWGVGVGVDHHSVDELVSVVCDLRENRERYKYYSDNCILHQDEVSIEKYNSFLEEKIKLLLESD